MEHLKRAEAPYRFYIPDDLVPRLRELQSRQKLWSELVDAEDVVHLTYGLGPAMFLAFDGRVIVDDYFNETGVYEVTDPEEAWVAVAIGADAWEGSDLCRLLPKRPVDAVDCHHCNGEGWLFLPTIDGRRGKMVCWECGALGWLQPSSHKPGAEPDRRGIC